MTTYGIRVLHNHEHNSNVAFRRSSDIWFDLTAHMALFGYFPEEGFGDDLNAYMVALRVYRVAFDSSIS